MKSIFMTTSAVLLVTGLAAGQAEAACPEDIEAFDSQYQQALQTQTAGQALSTSEQAELFGLKTAAENLHAAGDAETCAQVIQRANAILDSAIAPQVIRPDELIGLEVTNAAEEDLGEIDEVMLDPVSGRIAYVVIEHGGFLGIGQDRFAVPWRAMTFLPGGEDEEGTVLLEIPRDRLENAPRFSRGDETPLERREWVTSVHSYYGVEPYWQDRVGNMGLQYGEQQPTQGGTRRLQADVVVIPADRGEQTEGATEEQQESGQQSEGAAQQSQGGTATQSGAPSENTSGTQGETAPQTETESEAGTEPRTEGETGGTGTRSILQPADDSSGTQAQSGQPEAQSDRSTMALSQPAQSPQAGAAGGQEAQISTLLARMDELERQVETLSEQGSGEQVAGLEERVQTLEQQLETEVQDRLARLEDQVQELSGQVETGAAQAGGAQAQQTQAAQSEAQAGQTEAAQQQTQAGQGEPAPAGQTDDAQQPTQTQTQSAPAPAGQADEPQQRPQMQGGRADQTQAADEGGQQQGSQPSEQAQAQQPSEDQQAQSQGGSGEDTTVVVLPVEESESGNGEGSGAARQQGAAGAQQQTTGGEAADEAAAAGGAGSDEQTAALNADGVPCGEGIAQLEEDMQRAEQLGVAIDVAQDELRDAEANAGSSEALCRAAIKRAHDELLAAGFEPTPLE